MPYAHNPAALTSLFRPFQSEIRNLKSAIEYPAPRTPQPLLHLKIIHNLAGSIGGSGNFDGPFFLVGVSNDSGQSDNPFMHVDINVKRSNFRLGDELGFYFVAQPAIIESFTPCFFADLKIISD